MRTDPDAPKHKGISALIIPTDTPGIDVPAVRRHQRSGEPDFNEVFFTDVAVPAENLVGPLNGGWGVANGSLGHERTMMWIGFADRIDNMIADFRPRNALERDQYATTIMDYQALGRWVRRHWPGVRAASGHRVGVGARSCSVPRPSVRHSRTR